MVKKAAGPVLLAGGILMALAALFADQLGFGDVDPDHFVVGTKQLLGIGFGLAVAAAGGAVWFINRK